MEMNGSNRKLIILAATVFQDILQTNKVCIHLGANLATFKTKVVSFYEMAKMSQKQTPCFKFVYISFRLKFAEEKHVL